jgi:hypothetical protein
MILVLYSNSSAAEKFQLCREYRKMEILLTVYNVSTRGLRNPVALKLWTKVTYRHIDVRRHPKQVYSRYSACWRLKRDLGMCYLQGGPFVEHKFEELYVRKATC